MLFSQIGRTENVEQVFPVTILLAGNRSAEES